MAHVPLPIDPLLPDIVAKLRSNPSLVLEAPPGAGKTTRVPRGLLEAGVAGDGAIVVLQPRRLATRLAAARVADELGQRLGQTVGYQVRFEDVSGPSTRLFFVTEGVLTRRLVADPLLEGVSVVVLDEFHERHLAGDLALAVLRELQRTRRPDLKLVAMSATLEADPVARFLGCPILRSECRRFDVTIDHLPAPDERPLEQQVLGGLKRLFAAKIDGDVLVFLPGAAEIRRARDFCAELAARHELELCALHGDLMPAEQDRAVRPGKRRKVILSTNVAETSVTIEGVAAVIDSGLARVASHSPWSGLPTLRVAKISKASATQRAGRAGRTRAGHCLRLYTKADFDQRPDHDAPEIRRLDLTETVLALRAMGVRDVASFPFFEPPPASALEAADTLLRRLGAVDRSGDLTDIGKRLLRFPVHPRQGRILVEAERRGVASEGAAIAALLGERDVRREARTRLSDAAAARSIVSSPSDLLEMLDRLDSGRDVDPGAAQAVDRVRRQLTRAADRSAPRPASTEAIEDALMLAVLAGYPDRVAKRRRPNSPELLLFGGGTASLAESSVVKEPELLVAVDAEQRPRQGVVVRIASKVEPEWLLELCPDELSERDELEWNAAQGRVERIVRLSYGNLVLEESRNRAPDSDAARKLFADKVLAAGPSRFADPEELEQWLARVDLLGKSFPDAGFPAADESLLRAALEELARSAQSLSELEGALLAALESRLSPEQQRLLRTHAPERVSLPSGRQLEVRYERGKPPHVESRLQDFFGMAQGPSVCAGRVPLVLHLLAPNQRALQVTTDLAGFWERHYPALRKELMRKYPKHSWPEDPRRASPPAPRRSH